MRRSILFIILTFLILEGKLLSSPEKKEFEDFNIREVTENISKVKKTLDALNLNPSSLKINIERDPFIPLLEKVKKEKEKTKKKVITKKKKEVFIEPEFNLSGIIYDDKKPIVILNNKVVEEKTYIGEYQIYKIFPEKVIIKYKNRYFVISPYKKEKSYGGKNEKKKNLSNRNIPSSYNDFPSGIM